MTFSDYNAIAIIWIEIFMAKVEEVGRLKDYCIGRFGEHEANLKSYESYLKSIKDFGELSEAVRDERTSEGDVPRWVPNFKFLPDNLIGAKGIVLPHVTTTGAVPILVMNEGFGFGSPSGKDYGAVDFLAVSTAQQTSYDYLRGSTPYLSWFHDYEHYFRARRFDVSVKRMRNIAMLRTEMKKLGEPTYAQAELAFFMIFHESQTNAVEIRPLLEKKTRHCTEVLSKEIVPNEGFDSIEQYETYIKSAKSLGFSVEGESIVDQYRSFLGILIMGYNVLLELAHFHDR
jgi:hypothetical protein